jgi:hypothetical protein
MLITNNGAQSFTLNLRDGSSYVLKPGIATAVPDAKASMIDDSPQVIAMIVAGTLGVTTDAGGAYTGLTSVNSSDAGDGRLMPARVKNTGGTLSVVDEQGNPAGGGGSTSSTINAVTVSASTFTLTPTASAAHRLTLNTSSAITIGPGTAGVALPITVEIAQGGSGGFVPTFPNVNWAGGVPPTFNTIAGKRDIISLLIDGTDVTGAPYIMGRLPNAAPGAPTGMGAAANDSQITITATAPVSSPAITGWAIYRGTVPGFNSATPIATPASLPYTDTGLTNGTTYYYRVAAINAVGTGTASAEFSGTPAVNRYATFDGGTNAYLYTPMKAQAQVGTQTLQIDVRVAPTSSKINQTLFSRWQNPGVANQHEYWFRLGAGGVMDLLWSPDGTTIVQALATVDDGVGLNVAATRRVICNPVTGVVTFWISTDDVTFTQVGATVTASGATAAGIQTPTSTTATEVCCESGGTYRFTGRLYRHRLTIGGVVISNCASNGSAWADTATPGGTASVWTPGSGAVIS